MNRRAFQPGFTLLELVLVMVIACTALALAAPSMTGWRRGAQLRGKAEEFLAMARLARTQAITNATTYRVVLDVNTATFRLTVQQGDQFVDVNDTLSQPITVPEGSKVELTKSETTSQMAGSSSDGITFYPNGRTEPAKVRFSDDAGRVFEVECVSPAEYFFLRIGGERA
jgi:type II secretion system protein H